MATAAREAEFKKIHERFLAIEKEGVSYAPSLSITFEGNTTKSKGGMGGGSYTEYKINLMDKESGETWAISKRFSDFDGLDKVLRKIKKFAGVLPVLQRGSTSIIGRIGKSKSERIVQERNRTLQKYLKQLVSKGVLFYCDAVQEFLEMPKDLRRKTKAISEILSQPLKEGYMTKQGGNYKTWKKRWCRVYPDWTLQYFEDQTALEPKGLVDFNEIDDVRELESQDKNPHVIGLHTKGVNGRIWKFACETKAEQEDWIATFNILIKNTYQFTKWNNLGITDIDSVAGNPDRTRLGQTRTFSTASATSSMFGMMQSNPRDEEKLQEYKQEIDRLKTAVQDKEKMAKDFRQQIDSMEKQLREHQIVVKQASKDIQSMLQEMKKQSTKQKAKEAELQDRYETTRQQLNELTQRNRELENLLKVNNLKMVASPRKKEAAFSYEEQNKERIISGSLAKFGKGGTRRAKTKHVIFVAVGEHNFVEWSDGYNAAQTTRMQINAVSTDPSLVSRNLTKDEQDKIFVLKNEDRVAVFKARDKEQRDQWLNFARDCGVLEVKKA